MKIHFALLVWLIEVQKKHNHLIECLFILVMNNKYNKEVYSYFLSIFKYCQPNK